MSFSINKFYLQLTITFLFKMELILGMEQRTRELDFQVEIIQVQFFWIQIQTVSCNSRIQIPSFPYRILIHFSCMKMKFLKIMIIEVSRIETQFFIQLDISPSSRNIHFLIKLKMILNILQGGNLLSIQLKFLIWLGCLRLFKD